jgi:hypothetical protein
MTTSLCTTSAAGYSASRRLLVARVALILGWMVLVVCLPMPMFYVAGFWNPLPLTSYSTFAVVRWFVDGPNQFLGKAPLTFGGAPSHFMGTFLLSPFFVGLAAGTLAALVPVLIARPRLLWACRIGTMGIFGGWILYGGGQLIGSLMDPNILNEPGGIGMGFLFCVVGSLLIGLSAWIRPAGARKSDSGTSRQRAVPPFAPPSDVGDG